jgi:hypothetical protein
MARSLGDIQGEAIALETLSQKTFPGKQRSMYARVFIASTFRGFHNTRTKVLHEINSCESLKGISLEKGHRGSSYGSDSLSEIVTEIKRANHFIIFVGGSSGTKINSVHDDKWITPEEVLSETGYAEMTFLELEVRLATKRLRELSKFHGHQDERQYMQENVLVVAFNNDHVASKILAPLEMVGVRPEVLKTPAEKARVNDVVRNFVKKVERNRQSHIANYLRWRNLTPKEHLQIIGWSGLENYDYKPFLRKTGMCDDQLAFLSMNRSVVSLPQNLTYTPWQGGPELDFDFVIADVEVVPHYIETNAIRGMHPDSGKLLSAVDKRVETLATQAFRSYPNHTDWAIPLMFGFNEFLVRPASELVYNSGDTRSYSEFNLASLLAEKDGHVVLWSGWWVPTFACLIYAQIKMLQESLQQADFEEMLGTDLESFKDVEHFSRWLWCDRHHAHADAGVMLAVEKVTDNIIATCKNVNLAQLAFLDNLDNFAGHIKTKGAGECVTIVGATSSFLPANRDLNLKVVRPKEGLFVWINCVCVTNKAERSSNATDLIRHWLSDSVQKEVWAETPNDGQRKAFFGIPVTSSGISVFCEDTDPFFDELRHTLEVTGFSPSRASSEERPLPTSVRPFPSNYWPMLEYHWTRLRRELTPASRQ